MITTLDRDAFRKHGFTEDEIDTVESSIRDFETTGVSYSHEEVFSALRKKQDQYRLEYA